MIHKIKIPKVTTIDFETDGIEGRPDYPPLPIGVSIKPWGKKARYYGWDHNTKNNRTKTQAKKALLEAYKNPDGILFQNCKFDIDVAEEHLKLKRFPWVHYHDTLFLLFLHDPHAKELSLKPSAERLLGMKPEEKDAVCEWLLEHQPVEGVKISASYKSDYYFMKYLRYAPGDLVGKYANGDTIRTEALFKFLYADIVKRGMLGAYDRERELVLILLDLEREGVPVDHKKLRKDVKMYSNIVDQLEMWILKRLKLAPIALKDDDKIINIDSGAQLVDALIDVNKIDVEKLGVTPKSGKYKTDKVSLQNAITDDVLGAVLVYRSQLKTCLNTFMKPWLKVADKSGGLIYTYWNQVRSTEGKGSTGARTGRLSSRPNFQNIPNVFKKDKLLSKLKFTRELPELPKVRSYIVPLKGQVLINRDYSQQELRILGHFEDGVLLKSYLADPWLDVHEHARVLISKLLGREFERKPIKNTGFGLIYGMGLTLLALASGISYKQAKEVKQAYLSIFPGLKVLTQEMKARSIQNLPIKTWGGREYYCEPPSPSKLIPGTLQTFDYKMLNVLIQGSAADCTKQAIIDYHNAKGKDDRLLLTVHDELLAMTPKKNLKKAMAIMQKTMEAIPFDIPMLSEGTYSTKNWVETKLYDKKGKVLYNG